MLGVERLVGLATKINAQEDLKFYFIKYSLNNTMIINSRTQLEKTKISKKAGRKQIKAIDVGGGIPTDYHSDSEKMKYSEYADILFDRVPGNSKTFEH